MNGSQLITKERERQISEEGWTSEHDLQYKRGELASAAIAYLVVDLPAFSSLVGSFFPVNWSAIWWKPKDRIRNLVRAGALIAAEIDRLQREALKERWEK